MTQGFVPDVCARSVADIAGALRSIVSHASVAIREMYLRFSQSIQINQ